MLPLKAACAQSLSYTQEVRPLNRRLAQTSCVEKELAPQRVAWTRNANPASRQCVFLPDDSDYDYSVGIGEYEQPMSRTSSPGTHEDIVDYLYFPKTRHHQRLGVCIQTQLAPQCGWSRGDMGANLASRHCACLLKNRPVRNSWASKGAAFS